MPTLPNDELMRQIEVGLRRIPPAPWVVDMIRHFQRTGSYRPEDLRRLLGDPNRSVEVGPCKSLAAHFTES